MGYTKGNYTKEDTTKGDISMGLFNKVCEYLENEKGLKGGYYCTLTGKHISSSDTVFKEYCDTSSYQYKCPERPENK